MTMISLSLSLSLSQRLIHIEGKKDKKIVSVVFSKLPKNTQISTFFTETQPLCRKTSIRDGREKMEGGIVGRGNGLWITVLSRFGGH